MKCVAVVSSFVLALLLCEVVLRIWFPQDLNGSIFVYTSDGLRANRSTGTALYALGCRHGEYRFATPHLRDLDRDLPTAASAPLRKVLVVGDSFTFGSLVPDRATYVRQLEDRVNAVRPPDSPRFRFLDAATGGWGLADYTVYLRDYLPRVRPQYVLVFINTDDVGRALVNPLVSFQGRLVFHSAPLSRTKQVTDHLFFYNYSIEHSHLAALTRKAFLLASDAALFGSAVSRPRDTVPGNYRTANPARARELGRALLGEIVRLCRDNEATLVVTTTGFMKFMSPTNPTNALYYDLPSFLAEHGVPFIDVSDEFAAATRSHIKDYLIPLDEHPNERANALIAAMLSPRLCKLLFAVKGRTVSPPRRAAAQAPGL